ncbi:MAG: hypothetical protein J3K34DRAFT_524629, partial [Monoraphidium minutum]
KSLESWQIRESRGRTPYISPCGPRRDARRRARRPPQALLPRRKTDYYDFRNSFVTFNDALPLPGRRSAPEVTPGLPEDVPLALSARGLRSVPYHIFSTVATYKSHPLTPAFAPLWPSGVSSAPRCCWPLHPRSIPLHRAPEAIEGGPRPWRDAERTDQLSQDRPVTEPEVPSVVGAPQHDNACAA